MKSPAVMLSCLFPIESGHINVLPSPTKLKSVVTQKLKKRIVLAGEILTRRLMETESALWLKIKAFPSEWMANSTLILV